MKTSLLLLCALSVVSVNSFFRSFKTKKDSLQKQQKVDLLSKYGNAASDEKLPAELLLGQTEQLVEYDRAGRILKGQVQ